MFPVDVSSRGNTGSSAYVFNRPLPSCKMWTARREFLVQSRISRLSTILGVSRRSMSTGSSRSIAQNAHRPENWKDMAPFPPQGATTYSRQSSLPKLPIPPFESTIEKLKRSLEPLAHSEEELQLAIKKVEAFAKENGPGMMLHQRLNERREQKDITHWLEEFWDNGAYLKYRDSVMINVSYYYGFAPHPSHLPQEPVARAAAIIRSALLYRGRLKRGEIPIEMARKDPMCMDTARWMFDCCRIPGLEGADWSISTNKETDTGSEGHIIVIRRGRFWKIDITTYEGGKRRLLSTAEIQRQLQAVYDSTDKDYPAIGTLTTQDRDAWAKDYAALVKDPHNASILEDIISSAFVVCLDTNKPTNVVETSVSLFHGGKQGESLRDRWYDKPCQFVIYDNGEAGFIGEHSVMDGTPTVTMCDVVLTDLHDKNFDHGAPYPTPASSSHSSLAAPKALDWASTPAIEGSIATAQKSALDLVRHQDLGMLSTSYGRDTIKKFGFSPDGWTQMLVQLAYTRLLNFLGAKREGGTYEAATTRKFYKGRTETIRIVTNESMKWCNAMDDSSIGEEEKRNLLGIATDRHRNDALDAGNALGVGRHLFGMKHMLKPGDQIPEIYSDPLYQRASTWVLSTSAIFSPHFTRGYGWGQVVPNGFGVAYMTGFPDCLKFTITSRTTQPNAKFIEELQRASDDMYELFVKVEKPKQSKL